uniref:G-protein coupled receptors family 1 profile domain-containing protein n=1 Tax=Microcebus murinus TaxID=30608 RepID=A0A8C5XY24_MICMU
MRNHTITTFILLGLTDDPQLKVVIFIFLFLTYMLSVTGNLTIISLTFMDSHLKTAMYFFLQNFSFLEISFTSACIPDTCKHINRKLILCCWTAGLLIILPPLSLGLNLEFCDSNVIDHFVCDISCSETWLIEQMVIGCAVLTFIMTLVCVVLSYVYIIKTILQFPSAKQRKKAFSTCSSHIIVVSITYGSCIFIYVKPSAKESVAINKGVTVLTTSIAPMLNPFIYTLRNKQVKQAFNDSIRRISFLLKK